MHCTCGECTRQAPGRLSCRDLGRAQNAGPMESVPLWGTQEPQPERLRPGNCTQPRARSLQSNLKTEQLDWESTHAMSRGKPSVAETL